MSEPGSARALPSKLDARLRPTRPNGHATHTVTFCPVDQPREQAQRRELFERGLFVWPGAMGDQVSDQLGAAHTEEPRALVLAGPVWRRVRVVVQPKPRVLAVGGSVENAWAMSSFADGPAGTPASPEGGVEQGHRRGLNSFPQVSVIPEADRRVPDPRMQVRCGQLRSDWPEYLLASSVAFSRPASCWAAFRVWSYGQPSLSSWSLAASSASTRAAIRTISGNRSRMSLSRSSNMSGGVPSWTTLLTSPQDDDE